MNASPLSVNAIYNDIYINCRFTCLLTVLRIFNKDENTVLGNFLALPQIRNDTLSAHFVYRSKLDKILESLGIKETSIPYSTDLSETLMTALKTDQLVILKIDLFNQEISPKFYQKTHFRHNILVYGHTDKDIHVVEHAFGGSETFEAKTFSIDELNLMYQGYLDEFYHTGQDIADTISLYERINDIDELVYSKENFIKLLKEHANTAHDFLFHLVTYSKNIHNMSLTDMLAFLNKMLWIKSILDHQFDKLLPIDKEIKPVLSRQIQFLKDVRMKIIVKSRVPDDFNFQKYFEEIISMESQLVDQLTRL